MPKLLTGKEARIRLFEKGLSIKEFSEQHGLNKVVVSELLSDKGKRKALRGETRRAAILLGMKEGKITSSDVNNQGQ